MAESNDKKNNDEHDLMYYIEKDQLKLEGEPKNILKRRIKPEQNADFPPFKHYSKKRIFIPTKVEPGDINLILSKIPFKKKKLESSSSKVSKGSRTQSSKLKIMVSGLNDAPSRNTDILEAISNILNDFEKSDPKKPISVKQTVSDMTIDVTFEPLLKSSVLIKESLTEQSVKNSSVKTSTFQEMSRDRVSTILKSISTSQSILKKVNMLRYRENVFRAATKLAKEMPPFPSWTYKDVEPAHLQITRINVGGEIFEIADDTLMNLSRSVLSRALKNHRNESELFIDRDPVCFRAVVHFYCTGRLHVPPNVCLTYFYQELEFWGINEDFMEPCCLSEYQMYRMAGDRLKKYSEDNDQSSIELRTMLANQNKEMQQHTQLTNLSQTNLPEKNSFVNSNGLWTQLNKPLSIPFRDRLNMIMTGGDRSVPTMWLSLLCAFFIIISVFILIIGTTQFGRVDKETMSVVSKNPGETMKSYYSRTRHSPHMKYIELSIAGFFLAEILLRFLVCRRKLEFFRDTLNWVDMIATITTLIGDIFDMHQNNPITEAYLLILKLPRILRLFKLTATLRNGMEAFTLTLRASSSELQVVFLILLMVTVLFGSVIFVVEALTSGIPVGDENDQSISNIYIGMWWAITTMAGIGYGDYIPKTAFGQIIGSIAIMCGIIICQMPVPIFLKNFSIYYNQASARLVSQTQLLLGSNLDKTEMNQMKLPHKRDSEKKHVGERKFNKIFNSLKL